MWILVSVMLNMPLEDKIEMVRDETLHANPTVAIEEPSERQFNTVYVVYHREYDNLYRNCALNKCCRMSVRHMRRAMGEPTTSAKGCRDGSEPMSLWCPGSLMWCDPTYPKATSE